MSHEPGPSGRCAECLDAMTMLEKYGSWSQRQEARKTLKDHRFARTVPA